MLKKSIALAVGLAVGAGAAQAQNRDYVSIVGSSTVYPFATVVAENYGKSSGMATPKIESTGSGGGLKLFCAGVGVEHPDITNASRRIKQSEIDTCASNGVEEIIEVKVGYDGIVLANSRSAGQMEISLKDLFLALAKDVPNPDGSESLVANPYTMWNEINAELPAVKIEVLGPPPTSGTRDAFAELAMEGGCNQIDYIKGLKKSDKDLHKSTCHTVREDGAWIEAGENDNLIIQKLDANPDAFGVFGFSFLDQNADKVQGSIVDGVAPEFELIADGSYPVSRALFFYVKKAHVGTVPGLEGYLAEFTSEKAWGEEGYLADKGLIPMPKEERMKFAAAAKDLTPMSGL
jgi:phosphate transport system substrate-binding protein